MYVTVLSLPVSYRAYPSDPAAHLTAGVEITVGVTTSVNDEGIRRLLPEAVRDSIVQVRYQSTECKDTHTNTMTKMMMVATNSITSSPTTSKATTKMVVMEVGGRVEGKVVELSVVELSVVKLSVVKLSVVELSVVELSVVELSVVADLESVQAAAAR